jgi:hypothetical protein
MPYVNSARDVHRAMAEQVTRVNGAARAAAADEPTALRRQLADAQARIITLERELSEMRLLLASYEDSGSPSHRNGNGQGAGMTYRGAAVLTAREAAQLMDVSLSTVSRYCEQGFWRASRDASGRWLIDATQELRKKPRGSVRTSKSRK